MPPRRPRSRTRIPPGAIRGGGDAQNAKVHAVTFGRVRKNMLQRIDTGRFDSSLNPEIHSSIRFDRSWMGGTEKDVGEWIRKGYDTKAAGSDSAHADVYVRPRRRMRWTDDGDLDVGQVLVGSDFPYARWDPRLRKPGLAIVAEIAFNSGTPAEVLADYGEWITSQVKRLEMQGYDLEVTAAIPLRHLWQERLSPTYTDIQMTLKRANEAADLRQWSPMFSPAGFRGFGFCAIYLTALDLGLTPTGGLGQCHSEKWGVRFNADTRTLRLTVNSNSYEKFDRDFMTAELVSAIG